MSLEGCNYIKFYPCNSVEDFNNKTTSFTPVFIHHFFPNEFKFELFKNLDIKIFYTQDNLYTHLSIAGELQDSVSDGDILYHLLELEKAFFERVPFHGGFLAENQFIKQLESNTPLNLPGNPIHEFKVDDHGTLKVYSLRPSQCEHGFSSPSYEDKGGGYPEEQDNKDEGVGTALGGDPEEQSGNRGSQFPLVEPSGLSDNKDGEIYTKFTLDGRNFMLKEYEGDVAKSDSVFDLHRRAEWFCHWFIETFSNILYDSSWEIFLPILFPNGDACCRYPLVGLVTCYHFFTINLTRMRVSQFFLFPVWQRKGLGVELLKTVYNRAINDASIKEITVEDPAPSFSMIRDIVGLLICLERGIITPKHLYNNDDNKNLKVEDIANTCKESKAQSARLLDILLLAASNSESDDCTVDAYSEVRIRTKKRMKIEHEDYLTTVPDVKKTLAEMWEERFKEYIASLNKIRKRSTLKSELTS